VPLKNEVHMPNDENLIAIPEGAPQDGDDELKAMNAVVAALKPLRDDERRRVLEYVLGRFGAVPLQPPLTFAAAPGSVPVSVRPSESPTDSRRIHDIRSLKEAKLPRSANEMAALVAYYVSELAPAGERRNEINKADIERYFKSAGFALPADANFTLVNAKNAGYLDSTGTGLYKLNPVGYNLVVHRMGAREKKQPRRPRMGKATRKANKKPNDQQK